MHAVDIPRAWIAEHRNNWIIRRAAKVAEQFARAARNELNWSVEHNGERRALEIITKHHPGVILDVGSNVGQWASMAHAMVPGLELHCFEIAPQTFGELQRKFVGCFRVHCNPFGLSDRHAELSLNFYPDSTDRSSLVDQPDGFGKVVTQGRVMSGDAYLAQHAIDRVAFLKIDVEGHEMDVLRGFRESIGAGKIAAVQFEHGAAHVITRHFLGDFVAFFADLGYRVFNIFPDGIEPLDYAFDRSETFAGRNYLAVRDAP